MQPVFRFAPSPNGDLHLGHARSALLNHALARASAGRFLLRFEDIDRARCHPAFEANIADDLRFLGLEWDGAPRRQSEHFADYRAALDGLRARGLVYPAFTTRGQVRAHALRFTAETGRFWPRDPDGAPLYPGLDRALSPGERDARIRAGEPFAWRLDGAAAQAATGPLRFYEEGVGELPARLEPWGDVVLARRDVPTSYHLSVVVDDALQGVTNVVRGRDLLLATAVHRTLQALLALPEPRYRHHDLVLGVDGRKLSKSNGDTSLRSLRAAGWIGADIRRAAGV